MSGAMVRATRGTRAARGASNTPFVSLGKKAFLPCDHYGGSSSPTSKARRERDQPVQLARFKALCKGPPKMSKEKAAVVLEREVAEQAASAIRVDAAADGAMAYANAAAAATAAAAAAQLLAQAQRNVRPRAVRALSFSRARCLARALSLSRTLSRLPACRVPACRLPACRVPACRLPACRLPACHDITVRVCCPETRGAQQACEDLAQA